MLTEIFAYSTKPPTSNLVPPTIASPIISTGNVGTGTGINLTSNLGSLILPQFEGGTLDIDQSNNIVFSQDFTLSDGNNNVDASNNVINANGKTATFTGVFSDAVQGKPGVIRFQSNLPGANITLAGANSFTGKLFIDQNVTLVVSGSLSDSTPVEVGAGATYIVANSDTIGSLSGDSSGSITSSVIIQSNTILTVGANNNNETFSGNISGGGGFTKIGVGRQTLKGVNTYSGQTTISGGELRVDGSITTNTTVQNGATLAGKGTINGEVINNGTVAPGTKGTKGTLTVNGDYTQTSPGTLDLDVGGNGDGDLLQINNGKVTDLAGVVKISSLPGTSITPGIVYTGIATNPGVAYSGGSTAQADTSSVVGASGYKFLREDDPGFQELNNGNPVVDSTKLQFGWLQLLPDAVKQPSDKKPPATINPGSTTPGQQTITAVSKTGGAITQTATGKSVTNTNTCTANTGNSAACQQINSPGTGKTGHNSNTKAIATKIDAGASSIQSGLTPLVVPDPTTGKQQTITPNKNTQQQITTPQKPVVTPTDQGFHKVEVPVSGGGTQTIVVTKPPTVTSNPDGTHTTTFQPSGGQTITTSTGQSTGINTAQTAVALVNPDFLTVYNALFSIPDRQQLNQALHSISAEPYASMQSVALEALEQFRANTLALTNGQRLHRGRASLRGT